MSQNAKLLIVYNADAGMFNAVMHALHKAIKPETYPCSLCALTYGAVSMHGSWRKFLSAMPLNVDFYHRDDFAQDYPLSTPDLPAILLSLKDAAPRILIGAEELNAMSDLSGLMEVLETRLLDEIGASALKA